MLIFRWHKKSFLKRGVAKFDPYLYFSPLFQNKNLFFEKMKGGSKRKKRVIFKTQLVFILVPYNVGSVKNAK